MTNYSGPKTYSLGWNQRHVFRQASYQKWAADEFFKYITTHGPDLYSSAEKFVHIMDKYSMISKRNGWMFSVAYDVAVELLDIMYAIRMEAIK